MKTKKSKMTDYAVLYEILENDESGLIPKEAGYVMIDYYKEGGIESVYFSPPLEYSGEDITKVFKEMNESSKTTEEMLKIAVRLEASSVD